MVLGALFVQPPKKKTRIKSIPFSGTKLLGEQCLLTKVILFPIVESA